MAWETCQIDNSVHAFDCLESQILECVEAIFSGLSYLGLRLAMVEGLGKTQFTPLAKLLKQSEKMERLVLEFDEPHFEDIEQDEDVEELEWGVENRPDWDTLRKHFCSFCPVSFSTAFEFENARSLCEICS